MDNWIPVIINPAAGRGADVLKELNQVFQPAAIKWSVEVTLKQGDAFKHARQLVDRGAGIVAVYGGDGTVSEVATALAGTETALGILPGGTGNVLAYEFNIPRKFRQAARLLVGDHVVRVVDLGQVGERKFLLRAGVGLESLVIEKTPRILKDRFGLLAYGIAGLQALKATRELNYQLELEGDHLEAQGVLCTVANSGHLGFPGLTLSPTVNMDDGLLDVIVLRKFDVDKLISLLLKTTSAKSSLGKLQHWQVSSAKIAVDPPQSVQVDGDILGSTPIELLCIPGSLRVIIPPKP